MASGNLTWVSEFVFLGLSQTQELQLFLVLVFLLVYTTTVMGNLLIMVTVTFDSRLQTPMYFLLRNLAVLELCFSSVTAPKVLVDFLSKKKTISYQGCMAQIFFHFLGGELMDGRRGLVPSNFVERVSDDDLLASLPLELADLSHSSGPELSFLSGG
uniref:Uncharacterized protein n=1 Tax=Rangifer tarandus platyrhynchus TaxID=3082113 RepID=A0ACB0ELH6_RANTA|nr:unnamed protein product [Rangifer tarandus platyrhynchus]